MRTSTAKIISKSLIVFVMLATMLLSFFFLFSKQDVFAAEFTDIDAISDSYFNVKATASPRRSSVIKYSKEIANPLTGEGPITYCVYNWKDLDRISFSVTPNILTSTDRFIKATLTVGHIQTDDLQSSTGPMEEAKNKQTLIDVAIASNRMNKQDVTYYIDSTTEISESETKKIGKDYGLYKFTFNYVVERDGSIRDISPGSIYIAVMPDKPDGKRVDNLKIRYSVTSSNKLMNVYELSIANSSDYNYVKPAYIKWTVVGRDVNNVDYVLTESTKNSDPAYFNHKVIWNSEDQIQTSGLKFIFDSHDIEGTWVAYCTISNSDGSTKTILTSEEMSTIKVERKSYTLVIVLSVVGTLAVGSLIALFIYQRKKNNSI